MGERGEGDLPLYYETHVFVCTNRRPDDHRRGSCAGRGSEPLLAYMKGRAKEMGFDKVRVNNASCLDRCEQGPCVVMYPEGVWYKVDSRAAVDRVLETHLRDGGRVDDLLLPPEVRGA